MFINIGGETPENIEVDAYVGDQNCFSTEDFPSVGGSDHENVEFIISSSESDPDFTFNQASPNGLSQELNHDHNQLHSSSQQPNAPASCGHGFLAQEIRSTSSHAFSKYHCNFANGGKRCKKDINQLPHDHSWVDGMNVPRRLPSVKCPKLNLWSSPRVSKMWANSKSCWKNPSVNFLFTLVMYICFICFGAVCFQLIEKPTDQQSKILDMEIARMLDECKCLLVKGPHSELVGVYSMSSDGRRNQHSNANNQRISNQNVITPEFVHRFADVRLRNSENWSFGSALVFCMTVVTTIGYGHIVPQTSFGKVFCIIFGCIGIPFTLYLSSITISLVMPFILYWRAATVRWFYGRFSSPQPVISIPNMRCMSPSDNLDVGDVEKVGAVEDNHSPNTDPKSVSKKEEDSPSLKPEVQPLGKVNHSFDESDLVNLPGFSSLRRKSKSLTSIHSDLQSALYCSKIAKNIRKHTTIVLPEGSLIHQNAQIPNDVPADTARRIPYRNHYSTVSKVSVFLNGHPRHVFLVHPPLTLGEKLRALRKSRSTRARLYHLFMVVGLVTLLIIFVPAYVFMRLEPDWSYIDAVYFCFISLTTVGFGDFVPGRVTFQENTSYGTHSYSLTHELYNVAIVVYLIVGITMLMLLVRVYREMMETERRIKRDLLISKLQHSLTDTNMLLPDAPGYMPTHH